MTEAPAGVDVPLVPPRKPRLEPGRPAQGSGDGPQISRHNRPNHP